MKLKSKSVSSQVSNVVVTVCDLDPGVKRIRWDALHAVTCDKRLQLVSLSFCNSYIFLRKEKRNSSLRRIERYHDVHSELPRDFTSKTVKSFLSEIRAYLIYLDPNYRHVRKPTSVSFQTAF